MEQRIYTVSELTLEIKQVLETSFPRLWVEGEISNFKRHSSGHLYFTLKDEKSQINCAMWRFRVNDLIFSPQDGMKVLAQGDVQVYERGGNYQLIIQQLQPAGVGALQLAFEQLKQKLNAEGLFEASRKKPIPPYPDRIGVVTSPTGAAIRDIISVATRRYLGIQIILFPVRVQGEGAAGEISSAIRAFNEYGNVDVLIVGRGGGSLEDLWAFNEEQVARAIAESGIPVISAVGHEIDFSISDFVADRRAPTPSAAAELVIKDRQELLGVLGYYGEKMTDMLNRKIRTYQDKITGLRNSYGFRRPEDVVFQKMQRLDELSRNMQAGMRYRISIHEQRLNNMRNQINALNPTAVLKRGYSICYKDGKIIKKVSQLKALDMVQVKLAQGQFLSQVQMLGDSE